jgi:hypothetical protein
MSVTKQLNLFIKFCYLIFFFFLEKYNALKVPKLIITFDQINPQDLNFINLIHKVKLIKFKSKRAINLIKRGRPPHGHQN